MSQKIARGPSFPWHILLFAAYPVIHIAARNFASVDRPSLAAALLLTTGAAALSLWVALRVGRNIDHAALAVSLAFVFIFSYGPASRLFEERAEAWIGLATGIDRDLAWWSFWKRLHALLLPAFLIAYGLTTTLTVRIFKNGPLLTRVLNRTALVLIILAGLPWLASLPSSIRPQQNPSAVSSAKQSGSKPDIYYVILDSFCRPDILRKHYRCNPSALTDFLSDSGFYVAAESQANYTDTLLSLASSLNMRYLSSEEMARKKLDQGAEISRLLKNNEVMRYLKSQGYLIEVISSPWYGTNRFAFADKISNGGIFSNEFFRALAGATPLRILEPLMIRDLAQGELRNFERLAQSPTLRKPKFVFCHFLIPHDPYLFTADGRIKRYVRADAYWTRGEKEWKDMNGYVEQTLFAAKKTAETLKKVLDSYPTDQKPVILVQSDHGANVFGTGARSLRQAILNAYYFPDQSTAQLSPNISPVNSFRVVLNHFFEKKLDLLYNESTYTTDGI